MKRHPLLQLLSREHHHALVLARKARRAAELDALDARDRAQVWPAVRDAYLSDLLPHFAAEESSILPLLAAPQEELVARTLDDHRQLCALAIGGTTMAELADFGRLLAAHIRFEERELFPAVERALELAAMP